MRVPIFERLEQENNQYCVPRDYDQTCDCWLKLDVVTEVAYGKPLRALRTTLAAGCRYKRRRCGSAFVPSPEDESMTRLQARRPQSPMIAHHHALSSGTRAAGDR